MIYKKFGQYGKITFEIKYVGNMKLIFNCRIYLPTATSLKLRKKPCLLQPLAMDLNLMNACVPEVTKVMLFLLGNVFLLSQKYPCVKEWSVVVGPARRITIIVAFVGAIDRYASFPLSCDLFRT